MILSPIFTISGTVIHGEKVGRTLGFPTVNMDTLPPTSTAEGVYIGKCQIGDESFECLAYFGPRLVFGETKNCFEAYIYDFDREVYGKNISFEIWQFIRPPQPFISLEALRVQLERDKIAGRTALDVFYEKSHQ